MKRVPWVNGLAGEMDYSHWRDGMDKSVDARLKDLTSKFDQLLVDLMAMQELMDAKNDDLSRRISELERKGRYAGVQMP
jgi:hypothetical protein